MAIQSNQSAQLYPHPNMPEPPPPYSVATAPSFGHLQPGTSSHPGQNALSAEEEDKFTPSTHFHHQQMAVQPGAGQQQSGPLAQPVQQQQQHQHQHPFILPPGTVPQPSAPPPPHGAFAASHFQPGFVHSGQILIGQPVTTINGQIQTPQAMPNGGGGQVKVIYAVPLGPHEAQLECSNCRQPIRTRVLRRPGLLAWLICGALALVGCWPCCVLPFCMRSCQDAEHFCPNCNNFIGKYSRI